MLVGLTGGIGSGKSTVATRFAEAGLAVIDADAVARDVVAPGTPGLAAVVERFGDGVRDGDQLDRAALADIVFHDPDARADLEAITHPAIRSEIARRRRDLEAGDPDAVVVLDHPLLVETGQAADMDAVVVVLAAAETRRARLAAQRGMEPADIDARMAAQADDERRRAAATFTIDNDGTRDDLDREVARVLAALEDLAARHGRVDG